MEQAEVTRALTQSGQFRGEMIQYRKDGQPINIETTITALRDEAGKITGFVGVNRDITARKQAEEAREKLQAQLVQAQKMEAMGQLTAGIAHDFNNMLTVIMGFAELMKLKMLPADPLNDFLDKILGSGRNAAELVRQLMAFSRQQVLQPRVVDLNQAVDSMHAMLRRIIGEHVALETHLGAHLWPVKVDPNQMEQVIVNLAVNARDAMPRGGRLTVVTSNLALDDDLFLSHAVVRPGEYVVLSVSDTGSGMSAEVQSRLFEPFFTTKAQGKGSGLGLSMVYGIVQQSGGHIGVQSQVGRGTTFDIYLPRSQEAAAAPAPVVQSAGPATGGQETILVVEDNVEVRGLAISALKMQGYTMLEASNGEEALRLAAAHSGDIHLLLTDIVMPGMSGRALAEQLTARHPQLRVIYMSGYTHEVIDAHMAVPEPGQPFLQKPFTTQEVVRAVREALDRGVGSRE
jgi:signal transduction histidine kinase/ActR/RegA family two-component response regulator